MLNYLKEKIDEQELDEMVMMVFSLNTVNSILNPNENLSCRFAVILSVSGMR